MRVPSVGERATRSICITEDDIEAFAKLTGDRNPLHFDSDFARTIGFDGRIAHGMLTSSILSTLIGEDLPGIGAIFLEQRLRYLAPVYPGETVTGEIRVKTVRADKPVITLAARIARQDGTVVADGEVIVLMREARSPIVTAKSPTRTDAHSEISKLVAQIRRETGSSVPEVDPAGPGTGAKVVVVMLTPGPAEGGAQRTLVLSPTRNSDQTALNLRQLLREARLDEQICVFWNAIPWSLGPRREPTDDEVRQGVEYLRRFLALVRDRRALVAMGRVAQRACREAGAPAIEVWSPSPLAISLPSGVVSTKANRWVEVREGLRRAAALAAR